MKWLSVKGTVAVISTGLAIYLQKLMVPVVLLVAVMAADYITGMIKAWMTATLSSKIGAAGIVKKLCYLLVICVGMGLDWVITAVFAEVGIDMQNRLVIGLMVAVWLIINELISVLENISSIGVPLPGFLMKLATKLKMAVEEQGKGE